MSTAITRASHATTSGSAHPVIDSDDFRAGMAYAAHILRHAVNLAHGHGGYIPPWVERNTCCRSAVLGFVEGMAQGFDNAAGPVVDHEHGKD